MKRHAYKKNFQCIYSPCTKIFCGLLYCIKSVGLLGTVVKYPELLCIKRNTADLILSDCQWLSHEKSLHFQVSVSVVYCAQFVAPHQLWLLCWGSECYLEADLLLIRQEVTTFYLHFLWQPTGFRIQESCICFISLNLFSLECKHPYPQLNFVSHILFWNRNWT